MPPPKPRPSEVAAEAKRTYLPWIEQNYPHLVARSFLHNESTSLQVPPNSGVQKRLRVAIIDGDPVDVALDWYEANKLNAPPSAFAGAPEAECPRIPVVNMANEKRAGGDWESGLMAPEECFCRRSNLVSALTRPWDERYDAPHYPLPQTGGLYSPNVGMFFLRCYARSCSVCSHTVPQLSFDQDRTSIKCGESSGICQSFP